MDLIGAEDKLGIRIGNECVNRQFFLLFFINFEIENKIFYFSNLIF